MSMEPADTLTTYEPFYLWGDYCVPEDSLQDAAPCLPLDSIFRPFSMSTPTPRPSLFASHTLPARHHSLLTRNDTSAPAGLFVLLILLAALHLVYYRSRKLHIGDTLKSLFSSRTMDRVVRAGNQGASRLAPIALLLTATLATAFCLVYTPHSLTTVQTWAVAWTALSLAYLLRNRLTRLLGKVFYSSDLVETYITSNYFYHLALSTILTPLLFLIAYTPVGTTAATYALYGTVGLCLLMRVVRGLKVIFAHSNASQFYLFYYLCIVETAPVIVLTRMFFMQ